MSALHEDGSTDRSVGEIGRNLSEIKLEQRSQAVTMGQINEKLAAVPVTLAFLEKRISDLEKDHERRELDAASARRWLMASILLPLFTLVAAPIVTVIVVTALQE